LGLFTAPVRHLVHVSGLFRPISEHGIMGIRDKVHEEGEH
jgi:hypothetical protein